MHFCPMPWKPSYFSVAAVVALRPEQTFSSRMLPVTKVVCTTLMYTIPDDRNTKLDRYK